MRRRLIHSYPARFLFLVTAIVAALLLIIYRVLIKRDLQILSPNVTSSIH